MENVTYTVGNQRKIERFVLIIYSIYSFVIMILFARQDAGGWVDFFLLFGVMMSWIVHISKCKTYSFRAKFTAIMMQASVILYAVHSEELTRVLPVFSAFVVFLGLYGLQDIIGITVVSILLIFGWHGLVADTFAIHSHSENMNVLLHLGNMLLLEYVMYIWTKRNSEGSSQLLGAIEELKAAESSKNDFLANVSHEIRTPINSICGMSEIILREELTDKVKENVQDIQMAGRNLMAVVSDILDFSELQSGKIELEEEAYNITSTINDVINMTLARKSEKNIELIVDCNANIPCALLGDEKKLRRVIMNVVDNAIKFTDEGCVTIVIGYRKEAYGINLTVTVKDTGIGMDAESLEKIFSSFNQVDASRRRHEGGVGLGLAISNALVQKMGGAITVKSKLGKGSIIRCVIPQKVLDETPIVSLHNRENINVAIYIDMEQFDMVTIRDEYSNNITHLVEQLRGKAYVCRNFAELQRRAQKEQFSHIFISMVEYRAEQEYYDKLAHQTRIIVVLDRKDEKYVANPRLLKIYKPFYVLTIASVLNELEGAENDKPMLRIEKFVTRDVHVLAVDDNRTNLRVIQGLLSHYKIKVTTAVSGKEALEKVVSADYDFIFMDHMMPEMDGVETLHRIRQKVGTYYQKVPIIALSANAVAGAREILITEGFTDFLEKPVEHSVLERVLKRNVAAEKIISREEYNRLSAAQEENKTGTQNAINIKTIEKESMDGKTYAEQELFEIEGIDIRKGILYCNGKEQYIKVLQGYCEDCEDISVLAEQQFKMEDWKNYTITVHGMKSVMHSIGAMELSALAKELEFAGKEGKIDYIRAHHNELMEKYQKLLLRLRENKILFPQEQSKKQAVQTEEQMAQTEQTVQSEEQRRQLDESAVQSKESKNQLSDLENAAFDRIIADMEEAMYDLDGTRLLEILSELQKYQYNGKALAEAVAPVRRKIEMSDYVSAVEMVVRIKNKLANEER